MALATTYMPNQKRIAVIAAEENPDARDIRELPTPAPLPPPVPKTSLQHCRVRGDGITHAICGEPAFFTIEAFDENGKRRSENDDHFFVAIRASGTRVRARLTSVGNGEYEVRYLPTVSGVYSLAISLLGEAMVGSPFRCNVTTVTPYAPNCSVSGAALHKVIARQQHHFEVRFRDVHNRVSHSEELDVYVEKVPDDAWVDEVAANIASKTSNGKDKDKEARRPPSASPDKAAASPDKKMPDKGRQTPSPRSSFAGPSSAPALSVPPLIAQGVGCVVTSSQPLIVRESAALDSARIGQLKPGRRVVVMDLQDDGARALVALESDEPTHRAEMSGQTSQLELWREIFLERPSWWDEEHHVTRSPPKSPPKSPPLLEQKFPRQGILGWITIKKDGKSLVMKGSQLEAGDRQLYLRAWARRVAVDKSLEKPKGTAAQDRTLRRTKDFLPQANRNASSVFQNELSSDPSGIGFAFGGIEPGRLHAHGRPVDTHKAYFSIAMCGKYYLHVGLRRQGVSLPDSPFRLEVIPGPAHPLATTVPKEALPLRGVVGFDTGKGQGCCFVLQTRDKMGNACRLGGAILEGSSSHNSVHVTCKDLGDGTFSISFLSTLGGSFDVSVTIDGGPICGMPATLKMVADMPDISRTDVLGTGLSKTQAGQPTWIGFVLKDIHSNVCQAPSSFRFGMTRISVAAVELKNKWKTAQSDPYKGGWNGDQFEMHYTPTQAGELELFLWLSDTNRPDHRELFPNSPFKIVCVAGKSHADGSFIDGFSKLDTMVDKMGKKMSAPPGIRGGGADNLVFAGETILIKPSITDKFGNFTAAAEGMLAITMVGPMGEPLSLKPSTYVKAGLTTYESRYTPTIKGEYAVQVTLEGAQINGSPVHFTVDATSPDAAKSHYVLPPQPWYSQTPYEIILHTADKYGNACSRGGGSVAGRLQSATLPSGQDSNLMVTDRDDGTYVLHVNMNGSCDIKTIITVANADGPSEMPPIPMAFLSLKTAMAKLERQAREKADAAPSSAPKATLAEASKATSSTSSSAAAAEATMPAAGSPAADSSYSASMAAAAKGTKKEKEKVKGLKAAANEMLQAMGTRDERRQKLVAKEEAFQMAAEGFKEAGAARAATKGDASFKSKDK